MDKDIIFSINNHSKEFNKYFKILLHNYLSNNELSKAILYGTLNGGKRVRPFLVSIFSKLAKVPKKNYIRSHPEELLVRVVWECRVLSKFCQHEHLQHKLLSSTWI